MRAMRCGIAGIMLAVPAASAPLHARQAPTAQALEIAAPPLIDGRLDDDAALYIGAWLDTAGTGLYIVWNDTRHAGSLERTGIMAGPKQRQLVVKYSRLFNLAG